MIKHDMNKMRAMFQDKPKTNFQQGDSPYFPFWNMPNGSSCTIRFLPDANEENPFMFLVEKRMHELTINGKKKKVPCNYMYGEKCPICDASKAYYDAGDKINGKKYWRKLSYIAQALVKDSSLPIEADGKDPVGEVKRVSVTYTLHKIIKEAFESDLEFPPFDPDNGSDFIIKKDQQGDHASYVLSRFARNESALTPEELEKAESQMIDLRTALPKAYDYDLLEALLEADITGAEFDESRFPGSGGNSNAAPAAVPSAASGAQSTAAPVQESSAPADDTPFDPDPAPAASVEEEAQQSANDVLAAIKARRAAQSGS